MYESKKFKDIFYQFFYVPWMDFRFYPGFVERNELMLSDVFIGILRLCLKIPLSLPTVFWRTENKPFLLFSGTFNNYRTLNKLAANLPESFHVSIMGSRHAGQHFPDFYCYLVGLLKLRSLKIIFDTLTPLERRAFCRRIDVAVWVVGSNFVLKKFIGSVRPNVIVLANDHSPFARAITSIARDLKVRTAYIPHAPVGNGFPPLAMDYAFLDGEIQ